MQNYFLISGKIIAWLLKSSTIDGKFETSLEDNCLGILALFEQRFTETYAKYL